MPPKVYTVREDCPHEVVDDLIDNLPNMDGTRRDVEGATSYNDFARIAAGIASDRYSAGSRAASMTIIILLKFGHEAAVDFAKNLDHHEGF